MLSSLHLRSESDSSEFRHLLFAEAPLLLAVIWMLWLCGCSPRRTAPGTLTVALAVFPSEADRYAKFTAAFERANHVRVNIIAQSYTDILQAIRVQGGSRQGSLDLVELDLAMLGEARKYASVVDDLITPQARALFPDQAWAAATIDGHIYFVPHRLMWQALIYNRIEVPNPPSTWDELERFARAHPGKFALKTARYEGAICDVMPFVWSAGGSECTPDSPGSIAALTMLARLAPDLSDESAVYREMSVLEAQARGSVWIHFNWPFAMEYLASKGLSPLVDLSAPLPAGPDGRATPLGGGYLAIPVSAPHPELARQFLAWLLTRKTQTELSRELGWYGSVPPPPGSADAEIYSGFTAMQPYVRARPAVDCYADLSNRWQRAIRAVLFDDKAPRQQLNWIMPGGAYPASLEASQARCCASLSR